MHIFTGGEKIAASKTGYENPSISIWLLLMGPFVRHSRPSPGCTPRAQEMLDT